MSLWNAIKKYFGHDPEYQPWTVVRYPHIPYPFVEGRNWADEPVRGFVVSRLDLDLLLAQKRPEPADSDHTDHVHFAIKANRSGLPTPWERRIQIQCNEEDVQPWLG
nr:hypothetical protein [Rhodococcus sp. (in: high G+C Gram-positive bacteria)]